MMVILNKIVTQNGNMGKISVPPNMVGMEVYVVTKEELDRSFEYIDRALIKQKIYDDELNKLKLELEQFKNISNSRITYLEKIISLTTSKSHIDENNDYNENND